MTIQQLQFFYVAAQYLNHTSAAKQLYVSHTTLSHSLKRLESELGVSLMVRKGSTWRMTPEGKSFLECTKTILNVFDEWKKETSRI